MASDELSNYYSALLDGSYDCVDRIVLNAHFGLAHFKKNPDVRGVFLVLVPWPPDPASACGAPFISKAAEVGHADGMSVLGTMYRPRGTSGRC